VQHNQLIQLHIAVRFTTQTIYMDTYSRMLCHTIN
jgi:hypothetical protein